MTLRGRSSARSRKNSARSERGQNFKFNFTTMLSF